MVNLYAMLGIAPNATPQQIQAAMKKAGENQTLTLEQLQTCKAWLLNADMRVKYNAKLFAEHPEVLQQMIDAEKPKEPDIKATQSLGPFSEPQKEKPGLKIKSVQNSKNNNKVLFLVGGVILAVVAIYLLSGVVRGYNKRSEEVAAINKALQWQKHIANQMLDPDSARFREVRIVQYQGKDFLCGQINAKNSMGGYVGYKNFTFWGDRPDSLAIQRDEPPLYGPDLFMEQWQEACTGDMGIIVPQKNSPEEQ